MALYHARSFHQKVVEHNPCFTNGAWRGNHSSEWLIYSKAKATLTLSLSDILQWAATDPAIGQRLRLAGLFGFHSVSKKQKLMITPDILVKVYEYLMQARFLPGPTPALVQS